MGRGGTGFAADRLGFQILQPGLDASSAAAGNRVAHIGHIFGQTYPGGLDAHGHQAVPPLLGQRLHDVLVLAGKVLMNKENVQSDCTGGCWMRTAYLRFSTLGLGLRIKQNKISPDGQVMSIGCSDDQQIRIGLVGSGTSSGTFGVLIVCGVFLVQRRCIGVGSW